MEEFKNSQNSGHPTLELEADFSPSAVYRKTLEALPEMTAMTCSEDTSRDLSAEFQAIARRIGLGRLWLPEEMGGSDFGLMDSFRLMRLLGSISPSLAWNVLQAGFYNLRLQTLFPSTFEKFVDPNQLGCLVLDSVGGTMVEKEDKLIVNGSWHFAAATEQAEYALLGLQRQNEIQMACIPMRDLKKTKKGPGPRNEGCWQSNLDC